MKFKCKQIITLVLITVLFLGLGTYNASAKYFSDTYPGMLDPEFFDAFNYVSDNGWMGGTDATHFSPYQAITRGMFVTVLYRYSGSVAKYTLNFTDVPSGSYYYYPIAWAAYHGIVNGTTPTTFNPDGIISKEQMAVILYRYATIYEHKSYTPSSFLSITEHPDYAQVSSYARDAIRWAKTYHVFPLRENSQYINPSANMNRAYAALHIANYAKNVTGFPSKDCFSFLNNNQSFNATYVLGTYATRRLFSCIDSYYGERISFANADKELIRSKIGTEWQGSCFGYTY